MIRARKVSCVFVTLTGIGVIVFAGLFNPLSVGEHIMLFTSGAFATLAGIIAYPSKKRYQRD